MISSQITEIEDIKQNTKIRMFLREWSWNTKEYNDEFYKDFDNFRFASQWLTKNNRYLATKIIKV